MNQSGRGNVPVVSLPAGAAGLEGLGDLADMLGGTTVTPVAAQSPADQAADRRKRRRRSSRLAGVGGITVSDTPKAASTRPAASPEATPPSSAAPKSTRPGSMRNLKHADGSPAAASPPSSRVRGRKRRASATNVPVLKLDGAGVQGLVPDSPSRVDSDEDKVSSQPRAGSRSPASSRVRGRQRRASATRQTAVTIDQEALQALVNATSSDSDSSRSSPDPGRGSRSPASSRVRGRQRRASAAKVPVVKLGDLPGGLAGSGRAGKAKVEDLKVEELATPRDDSPVPKPQATPRTRRKRRRKSASGMQVMPMEQFQGSSRGGGEEEEDMMMMLGVTTAASNVDTPSHTRLQQGALGMREGKRGQLQLVDGQSRGRLARFESSGNAEPIPNRLDLPESKRRRADEQFMSALAGDLEGVSAEEQAWRERQHDSMMSARVGDTRRLDELNGSGRTETSRASPLDLQELPDEDVGAKARCVAIMAPVAAKVKVAHGKATEWVAGADENVPWLKKRAVMVASLMWLDFLAIMWMIWALFASSHTGWAALACALFSVGLLVAAWSGEIAGQNPSSSCPHAGCRCIDEEARQLTMCCLGLCQLSNVGMLATILNGRYKEQVYESWQALLMLHVYHGLWFSLPQLLLLSYILSQVATVADIVESFTTIQLIATVLAWVLNAVSVAVSVAVQRTAGAAIDSRPMFKRLAAPLSRFNAEAVTTSHVVLRVSLVWWFAAAYRGWFVAALAGEILCKFMFALFHCPVQRGVQDRAVGVAHLTMLWTPMNLVAPYSIPQRFRPRFPLTLLSLHLLTDLAMVMLPAIDIMKPTAGTALTGVYPVVHGLCTECDTKQLASRAMLTQCCSERLALWPFVLLWLLIIAVYAATTRTLYLDGQLSWLAKICRRVKRRAQKRLRSYQSAARKRRKRKEKAKAKKLGKSGRSKSERSKGKGARGSSRRSEEEMEARAALKKSSRRLATQSKRRLDAEEGAAAARRERAEEEEGEGASSSSEGEEKAVAPEPAVGGSVDDVAVAVLSEGEEEQLAVEALMTSTYLQHAGSEGLVDTIEMKE